MPQTLAEIRDDFLSLPEAERLNLLLEFSDGLPEVPAELQDRPELAERVEECQSPVWIIVEGTPDAVGIHAQAPAEAPTTRGFAGILVEGLSGRSAEEILAVPADFPLELGLTGQVSALRLRGMTGMLRRIQHRVRQLTP